MGTVSYTAQEWFELVWERAKVRRVSHRTAHSDACCYSARDGCPPCFIGAVLDPKVAKTLDEIGGYAASDLLRERYIRVTDLPDPTACRLLDDMQIAHDRNPPEEWAEKLRTIAETYNLTVPETPKRPTLIISMPITGHVDIGDPDVERQARETLTWEYTPKVTEGNVCYAETTGMDWALGEESK